MINVAIIDDEDPSCEAISYLLKKYLPEATIVGIANTVESAYDLIKLTDPDVIFLDVRMGNKDGFDLLDKFKKIRFKIIFITAYDNYSIRAFKYSAIDYILKPIDEKEFKRISDILKEEDANNYSEEKLEVYKTYSNAIPYNDRKIAITIKDKIIFLKLQDINYLESENNYTKLFFLDKSFVLMTKTLKEFEDTFKDLGFFRTHQSYLINMAHIHTLDKAKMSVLEMNNGEKILVSRPKRDILLGILKIV